MPKVSNSASPLARAETPIHALISCYQDYLHFPDPAPVYAAAGALAANMLPGAPVWLMMVGRPGSGKTEVLNSLLGVPGVYEAGSITGPGALLSGTAKKDKAKDATGGLLRKVGDHGAILL